MRNVFKYGPEYTPGARPELIEGDVFKTIIPLKPYEFVVVAPTIGWEEVRDKVRNKVWEQFGENTRIDLPKCLFHGRRYF